MPALTYVKGASKPDAAIVWPDVNSEPIDFSQQTITVKIGNQGSSALITKTTGITGAATFPNVTIVWEGELDTLDAGVYTLTLEASDGRRRNINLKLASAVA